jgi:glycosyltransferase involved in cell wall biosynthesis
MASGLPVICYGYGGQTDFLIDGVTGHVVPLNDMASFTDSCRRLISDRESGRHISAENLARVEELYIDNCARQYEQLFEDLISNKTAP